MDSPSNFSSAGFASCENASAIESLHRNQLINALAANRRKSSIGLLTKLHFIRKPHPRLS